MLRIPVGMVYGQRWHLDRRTSLAAQMYILEEGVFIGLPVPLVVEQNTAYLLRRVLQYRRFLTDAVYYSNVVWISTLIWCIFCCIV